MQLWSHRLLLNMLNNMFGELSVCILRVPANTFQHVHRVSAHYTHPTNKMFWAKACQALHNQAYSSTLHTEPIFYWNFRVVMILYRVISAKWRGMVSWWVGPKQVVPEC